MRWLALVVNHRHLVHLRDDGTLVVSGLRREGASQRAVRAAPGDNMALACLPLQRLGRQQVYVRAINLYALDKRRLCVTGNVVSQRAVAHVSRVERVKLCAKAVCPAAVLLATPLSHADTPGAGAVGHPLDAQLFCSKALVTRQPALDGFRGPGLSVEILNVNAIGIV